MKATPLFPLLLLVLAGCAAAKAVGTATQPVPAAATVPAAVASHSPEAPEAPATPQSSRAEIKPAVTQPSQERGLSLRATLSHTAYSQSVPTQLLVKVEFCNTDKLPANRPPLNIALVLDRSGSMADDMKFPHAIAAARAVIENLTERDFVSLVAFNESVLVLSPAGRVVNKPFLFQRLAEVSPGGVTDLSAGLLEGIAQVNSQSATGQVKHVLLLTDGQANMGVTEPEALRKLAESAHAKGIGISTLGCGADFNQSLLADLATAGGGRYTYVKSAEQLPAAFKQELRGLLAVVAQNVRLEVALKGGVITKIYGQPSQPPTADHQLQIGNLRAGERGYVMMALRPAEFQPGAAVEVSAKLTYDVPETSERIVRHTGTRARFAATAGEVRAGASEEVLLCGATMDALDLAADALQSFDSDRYATARASFEQSYERTREYARSHGNQDLLNETFLLKHFLEELEVIRGPGEAALGSLSGDTRNQIEKQAGYHDYQLLHHEMAQSGQNKETGKAP